MADAKCVENTNDSLFYCKVAATTDAACGIANIIAGAVGTPVPCLAVDDKCTVNGTDSTISHCKTKAATNDSCGIT